MKYLFSLFCYLPFTIYAQTDIDTVAQSMITMQETTARQSNNGLVYYEKGKVKPYTGILYGTYDNGELLTMQEFKDGIGNGTWVDYDPDGRKSAQGTYVNNRVEGPVTLYYENGSIKAKGQYRHWKKPIGKWTYFDRKGNVVDEIIFTP